MAFIRVKCKHCKKGLYTAEDVNSKYCSRYKCKKSRGLIKSKDNK